MHRVASMPHRENERPGNAERGEAIERAVYIRELGADHHSEMKYEVVVEHPEYALHPEGAVPRSRQAPEIYRFAELDDAKRMYAALVRALGGDLPNDFEEPESSASSPRGDGITSGDVLRAIDAATAPLVAKIAELEKRLPSK